MAATLAMVIAPGLARQPWTRAAVAAISKREKRSVSFEKRLAQVDVSSGSGVG